MFNLTRNTAELEAILAAVNALPSNGSTPEDLNAILTEQEELITTLQTTLRQKTAGSGGEDLTTEIDEYTAKLTQLEEAIELLDEELRNKASGSGGTAKYKTCTIRFVNGSPDDGTVEVYRYSATCVKDGDIQMTYYDDEPIILASSSQEIVIENVLCGSTIHISHFDSFVHKGVTRDDGGEVFLYGDSEIFKTSDTAGAICTISFISEEWGMGG